MLKIALLLVTFVIIAFVIIVLFQPAHFTVSRNAEISAPVSVVFAQVNDFHRWQNWNPWGKLDPLVKQTYEGQPAGTGAIYRWTGNREVGQGRMTITESVPGELIRLQLEFFKPFRATNIAKFSFRPEGARTAVTWSMFGEKNFVAKALHLFINMDKMIGGQFEKGLTSLKAAAEAAANQGRQL